MKEEENSPFYKSSENIFDGQAVEAWQRVVQKRSEEMRLLLEKYLD